MPVSTREERRLQRKSERQAAQRKAAQRDRVRRWGLLGGGIGIILIAAIVIAVLAVTRNNSAASASLPGQRSDDPVTQSGGLYTHIPDTQPIQYASYPPNHGDHYPTPMPWGVYDTQVQDGRFVHNLEHGGIDVLYHCPTGCADTVTQLNGLMTSLPKEKFGEVKLVVTPYDKTTHLITLLAWDYEQDLDTFDADAIKAFYQAHVDKGPEQVQ